MLETLLIIATLASVSIIACLTVRCALDTKRYPDKIKVTDQQMAQIRLVPDTFHGDWNYTIRP